MHHSSTREAHARRYSPESTPKFTMKFNTTHLSLSQPLLANSPYSRTHAASSGTTPLSPLSHELGRARTHVSLPPAPCAPHVPLPPSLLLDFRPHEYLQAAIAHDDRHNVILKGHGVEGVLGRRVVELPCRFGFRMKGLVQFSSVLRIVEFRCRLVVGVWGLG